MTDHKFAQQQLLEALAFIECEYTHLFLAPLAPGLELSKRRQSRTKSIAPLEGMMASKPTLVSGSGPIEPAVRLRVSVSCRSRQARTGHEQSSGGRVAAKPRTGFKGTAAIDRPPSARRRSFSNAVATPHPAAMAQGLTAFGKFNVQPQGKNFLVNFGFESGNISGWSGQTDLLRDGSVTTPTKLTVVSAGFDPIATDLPTTVFGQYALRINDETPGYHRTYASQRTIVPASGNPQLTFKWAAVLEDPHHHPNDQPYVDVIVRNITRGEDIYRERYYTSDPSFPGWKDYRGGSWKAIPWQSAVLPALSAYANDEIELRIEGADCRLGAHGGYVYLDGEE